MPFNKCHGICTLLKFFCVIVCALGFPCLTCNSNDVIVSFTSHGYPSQVIMLDSKYLNNFSSWDLKKKKIVCSLGIILILRSIALLWSKGSPTTKWNFDQFVWLGNAYIAELLPGTMPLLSMRGLSPHCTCQFQFSLLPFSTVCCTHHASAVVLFSQTLLTTRSWRSAVLGLGNSSENYQI